MWLLGFGVDFFVFFPWGLGSKFNLPDGGLGWKMIECHGESWTHPEEKVTLKLPVRDQRRSAEKGWKAFLLLSSLLINGSIIITLLQVHQMLQQRDGAMTSFEMAIKIVDGLRSPIMGARVSVV
jgi:hypothetical protein